MKPITTLERITPEMAKAYLNKNENNRPISKDNLNVLVMEMKRENFHNTGETIKFSKSGSLLDGQHRLMAILQSGKAQELFVTRGLSEDAFQFIDTGRKRTASDVLGMEGFTNPARLSAMINFVINFTSGNYSNAASNHGRRSKITNMDISKFAKENADSLSDSMQYGFAKENKLVSGVTLSDFHFAAKKKNKEAADDFCWKLACGESLGKENPIYLLRQKYVADLRSTKTMSKLERIALLCKAWNLYRTNKRLTVLKWDSNREPFPKLI